MCCSDAFVKLNANRRGQFSDSLFVEVGVVPKEDSNYLSMFGSIRSRSNASRTSSSCSSSPAVLVPVILSPAPRPSSFSAPEPFYFENARPPGGGEQGEGRRREAEETKPWARVLRARRSWT